MSAPARSIPLTTTTAATTDFNVAGNVEFSMTLNGEGAWQYYDGAGYIDFVNSNGRNVVPHNGKLRLRRASGTVIAEAVAL